MSELALKLIAENKAKRERGEDASYLDLGRCGLTTLPDLSDMEWLETLVLSNRWWGWEQRRWVESTNKGADNILTGIPAGLLPVSLRSLYASVDRTRQREINNGDFLKSLINLQSLVLAGNQISNGDFLKNITALKSLDLSENQISNGDFLKNLTNLKALALSGNQISDGGWLKNLTNLQSLDLSRNQISSGDFLKNLTNLRLLDLGGNQISNGDFLENLVSLRLLDLRRNQIADGNFLKKLTNLQSLYLRRNQISNGDFLKSLISLRTLDLGENQIHNWFFLENLVSLQLLDIRKNQIADGDLLKVPASLQSLYLRENQIRDGFFLKNLPNLKALDLSYNQIDNGDVLKNLINLQSLYLRDNQIRDGFFLKNLINLQSLDLSYNQISSAGFLKNLTNLKSLNFSGNQISNLEDFLHLIKKGIPVTIEKNGSVLKISLYNNPIIHPPLEIVEQGNAAILNWFAERSKQQFQNTEIKLVFIGNSTAGKTSLSRYLRERVYEHGQPTTHGIQRDRWLAADDLQVNIWDFGGQEYYHATHRLFLSRNSVYVLVWDACTDKGGTEPTEIWYPEEGHSRIVHLEHFPHLWWLKNIRHFTSGSNPPVSVLLVQNKSARDGIKRLSPELEKPPFDLLPEWIDNHIDIATSAQHQNDPQPDTRRWQRSFEEFEERLFDKLKSQLTHYEFAIYHRDIRDRVRALASGDNPVNEMSWTEFEEMCRDIEPDAKMDLVQIYLRDITGDILYFDKNERLRHRVFLRPDWVCNRIYTILSRKVLERQGLFDLAWVREALQCGESEALDFVELMREFQLVFAENDETGTPTGNYVAPQYLPDACTHPGELDGAKKYANLAHAFTLWFPEFLPKSHIARFVAHWGGNAKQRLFWKNGLLFQTVGCTALVERSEEYKIRVDIQAGDTAKRAAAMGRIFQSFLDLEDGQAGFAVSLNAKDFVWWPDAQEAIHTGARQVKTHPPEAAIYTNVQPFMIFQKPVTMAKKVFISYSKHDRQDYLEPLLRYLHPLVRGGWIEPWEDSQIPPGEEWDKTIRQEIERADIILLLVSDHSLNTDYIWNVEIEAAMRRHEAGTARVVPVILSRCLWEEKDPSGAYIFPPAKLNALPAKGKPVSEWERREEAWDAVAQGVKRICVERKG